MTDEWQIVGDVGGTNARFALVHGDDPQLHQVQILSCEDHNDLADALAFWLGSWEGPRPVRACIAVAGPISGDHFAMTNNHWSFSIRETAAKIHLDALHLCNDFEILAVAVPHLRQHDLRRIGPLPIEPVRQPKAVLGAGTGLGVATSVPVGTNDWHALTGEGGHVELGAASHFDRCVIDVVRADVDAPVSAETLLSGAGMVRLHNAVVEVLGHGTAVADAAEVTASAADQDPAALQTIESFIRLLASVAGDVALTSGARGGVLIGGGIMPKLQDWLDETAFREAFECKTAFEHYLKPIPTALITADFPAFIGARAYLASTS